MIAWIAAAYAGEPAPEVVDAVAAELARSAADLHLPDAPPLYHLRYRLVWFDEHDVAASAGALVWDRTNPAGVLGVEVRVGTPELDSTGFGGWEEGFATASLPRDVNPLAARLAAWRTTDGAYKAAVEHHARKVAQFTPPPDWPGSYTLTGPAAFDDGGADAVDTGPLTELASAVSAPLARPRLSAGEVRIGQESGGMWLLDTEGSRARVPIEECTVRVMASARADDGMTLTDQLLWTARTPAELPHRIDMIAASTALAERLEALAAAPPLEEEYVGPVVLSDHAAIDLFRYLLVPQLEGTPEPVAFDTWIGAIGAESGSVRQGRRVLPAGWAATDDPTLNPRFPGYFQHDWEGTPTGPLQLVDDGIARNLLMSRVPRSGIPDGNGHARGWLGDRALGRADQLTVTPPRNESAASLRKQALKLAKSYGRDWYVEIRRLAEPAVLSALAPGESGDDDGPFLPPPTGIYRVHADGSEELLRGGAFVGVERWLLRDIVAAGPQTAAAYMAPPSGSSDGWSWLGPTEGLPTWISAPAVLIGEAEVVPTPGDDQDRPVVPAPPLATGPGAR
jgi:hypothetical protein